MKTHRLLIITTLFILIFVVTFFVLNCSKKPEFSTITIESKEIINYDTLNLMFTNLKNEDTEEEKELALESPFFTVTKLKSKREFALYKLSANSIQNEKILNELKLRIKEIKFKKDTVNGIQVLFVENMPIKHFVKAYKLFIEEEPKCCVPTTNNEIFAWYQNKDL